MQGLAMHGESPETVELSLVGDFELRLGGRRVELPEGTQRLIGFLALHGRHARRSYVSGKLWPEAPENRAAACLRSALWRLPALDVATVVTSGSHLALEPELAVDVDRLRSDARAAVEGRVSDADLLETARRLCAWADDVLPGWDDDWVTAEREQLRQLRVHALECLGERLLSTGRHHDALQLGRACVAADPVRESGHRLVMRAHLGEGNVADAVRQYRVLAELLAEELGVSPSARTQDLWRECLG